MFVFHDWNTKIQNGKWKGKIECSYWCYSCLRDLISLLEWHCMCLWYFFFAVTKGIWFFLPGYLSFAFIFARLHQMSALCTVHCALCICGTNDGAWITDIYRVHMNFQLLRLISIMCKHLNLFHSAFQHFTKGIFSKLHSTECCKMVNPLTKLRHNINNNKRAKINFVAIDRVPCVRSSMCQCT